jgi:excisionase family DNA binding protein
MPEQEKYWFNVAEAAEYLGVTERWLRRQIDNRTIDYNQPGGRIRFRKDVLDELLDASDIPATRPMPRRRRYRTAESDVA